MAEKLPRANNLLLQHLLCLFHHISQHSDTNKMTAQNLAVCIAPTLLHRGSQSLDRDDVDKVRHLGWVSPKPHIYCLLYTDLVSLTVTNLTSAVHFNAKVLNIELNLVVGHGYVSCLS